MKNGPQQGIIETPGCKTEKMITLSMIMAVKAKSFYWEITKQQSAVGGNEAAAIVSSGDTGNKNYDHSKQESTAVVEATPTGVAEVASNSQQQD